jgi:DNA replication protein DnaC
MQPEIIKVIKACKTCGKEYKAHIGQVMNIKIEFGGGNCPNCCKKIIAEEEKREQVTQELTFKNKREEWRKSCGIPLRYQTSRFELFDRKVDRSILKVMRECQEYASKFNFHVPQSSKSLVMFSVGVWGLGKTYMACSVAHGVLDKWHNEIDYCPVTFISEPGLFRRIRATFNHNNDFHNETEEDIYRKLIRVPLLILDDVGKEEVADARFVQRVLFAIIDGRYQNMLPMVITANLNTDALDAHLGGDRGNSASMDRLLEMTGCKFMELTGQSYRDTIKRSLGEGA